MSIKHPYLTGSLSTRINAIGKDQKTESLILRALPKELVKENIDGFLDYIANQEELYSQACQKILVEIESLVEGESNEECINTNRSKDE